MFDSSNSLFGKVKNNIDGFADNLFDKIKQDVLSVDVVHWAEKYLFLDGQPFRVRGNGYKIFADIYRYISTKCLKRDSKPIVLVKGRQVGGSTMSCVLELYFMASGLFGFNGKPPMRILHCFPQLDIAKRHAKTRMATMISSSLAVSDPKWPSRKVPFIQSKIDPVSDTNDSLQYKQFMGGNWLATESCGLTGDRLRGYTADCIFFDEIQDIKREAINNTEQALKQAQYGNKGIKVYFGTPRAAGSNYWKMWNASTQNYYYLGCEECKKYFPLYTPGSDDWEKIWIEDDLPDDHKSHGYIVKCTHCGCEQDKREAAERGKWIPTNKEEDSFYIGYHINQLYMPNMKRNDIISQKPENHPTNNERVYRNEILGEFYSGDLSPLTTEDIDNFCADRSKNFVMGISPSTERRVYLGCDWGQKVDTSQLSSEESEKMANVGKSYSCAVILATEGPNILSIQYARILPKKDLNYKIQFIDEIYNKYNIDLGVGDIGDAGDLTEILQQKYGEKFLSSRAQPQLTAKFRFVNEHCPHSGEIQFDRNYLIGEMFNILKAGKIKFPYRDYEKIAWLVQHCTSMEIKPSTDRFGEVKINYVKGSTPNDGFMALMNAYLAYKYDISNGFKIKDPNKLQVNIAEKGKIPLLTSFLDNLDRRGFRK